MKIRHRKEQNHTSNVPASRIGENCRKTRRGGRISVNRAGDAHLIQQIFPMLSGRTTRYGVGICVASCRRLGDQAEWSVSQLVRHAARPGERPTGAFFESADCVGVARMVGGLAHADRLRIAQALACGAVSHHDLEQAIKLKTGPLYHHLRVLERAGVLQIRGRNEYVLSQAGRLLLLAVTVLAAQGTTRQGHVHPPRKARRATRKSVRTAVSSGKAA